MGDFKKDVTALKEYLYHTSLFEDYFSLKAEYETSKELALLRHEIARATALDPNNPNAFILREKYEMHPIMQDYNQVKEEVDNLLEEIKSILEGE
ncbi:MAG: hypothetical protein LUC31_00805 [Coprobacillus sp.]|nr:hypothetical protein [Coprobacillus sp.]